MRERDKISSVVCFNVNERSELQAKSYEASLVPNALLSKLLDSCP